MSDIKLTIRGYSREELDTILNQVMSAGGRAIGYMAQETWGWIRRLAPTDHGRLAGSFQLEKLDDLAYRIWSGVHYALYVHEGTGIYGPEKHPIVPKQAKALKFFWKKLGRVVVFKGDLPGGWRARSFVDWAESNDMKSFLTWPKGMEGRPYVEKAYEIARSRADEFIQRALKESV